MSDRPTLIGRQFIAKARAIAATTATRLVFETINGDTITLVEGDRISITGITVSNVATAKTVTVFQDDDDGNDFDAGEEIETFEFAGVDTQATTYPLPRRLERINAAGTNDLMVLASTTGNINITVTGGILSNG